MTARVLSRSAGLRVMFARGVIVITALSLPVFVFELFLRWHGPILPGLQMTHLYSAPHPLYGFARVPGTTGWLGTSELQSEVSFNSHGLREREIPYAKPPGERRILVLGDSFVEGAQVSMDETCTRVLEELLHAGGAGDVRVINAGQGGWGTAQQYEFLRHEGVLYQPDLVVLVFYTGNDVTDNSFRIKGNVRALRKPYYTIRDGELQLQPWTPRRTDGEDTGSDWWRASILWRTLSGAFNLDSTTSDLDDAGDVERQSRLANLESRVFSARQKRAWREAWEVTGALFNAVRDVAQSTDAELLLVQAPTIWEVYPDQWDEFRQTHGLPRDGWKFDAPREAVSRAAAVHGIDYLDLLPALREESPRPTPLYFQRDMHWTAAGHRVVASALNERIWERFSQTLTGN